MGRMQRAKRLRREIEGKARIRILPPRFHPLARAVADYNRSIAVFPPEMRSSITGCYRPRYSIAFAARRNGKTYLSLRELRIRVGDLIVIDEIATSDPAWFGDAP